MLQAECQSCMKPALRVVLNVPVALGSGITGQAILNQLRPSQSLDLMENQRRSQFQTDQALGATALIPASPVDLNLVSSQQLR